VINRKLQENLETFGHPKLDLSASSLWPTRESQPCYIRTLQARLVEAFKTNKYHLRLFRAKPRKTPLSFPSSLQIYSFRPLDISGLSFPFFVDGDEGGCLILKWICLVFVPILEILFLCWGYQRVSERNKRSCQCRVFVANCQRYRER